MFNSLCKKMIAVALLGMTTFVSCTTSTVEPTTTDTSTTKVAFEHATMKPFFDTYCASCHASGKSNYKDWLYDATDYATSIKGHISTIYTEVYVRKTMPENTTLTTAQLAAFKAWYDAGYAAK
jgi:mono/diheme cytochrome c family protein